jgi:hypothetical protein
MKAILFLGLLLLDPLHAAALRVSTDFDGGSAAIDAIDQERREIWIRPGGNPARGWPCWWFVRIDGLAAGETATLVLRGSERSARNNGTDTGKPLASDWAMPIAATVSDDGKGWRQTGLGKRETDRITYPLEGNGGPLWVAWGPPFTPRETEALLAEAERARPDLAKPFTLATTREGRPVRALQIVAAGKTREKPAVWVHARQHAWESGSSWVARGFVEWLLSDVDAAEQLRERAQTMIVPIMDVDRVVTGDGGKEAAPHDHNRDWHQAPHYPEVAAAQDCLRAFAAEGRLALVLDLHNPASRDLRPFFFVGPPDLLSEKARGNRERFLGLAAGHLTGPLTLDPKPRVTGPSYHPLWRRISGQWVNDHGNDHTLAACLETSWNTRHSTTDGYRIVGRQLGEALAAYLLSPGL